MTSHNEEEYFAREEIAKKQKFIQEVRGKMNDEDEANLKKLHFNHCPKCGHDLHEVVFKSVVIDKCLCCGAVTLDDGELEKLAGDESSFIDGFMGLFSKADD